MLLSFNMFLYDVKEILAEDHLDLIETNFPLTRCYKKYDEVCSGSYVLFNSAFIHCFLYLDKS